MRITVLYDNETLKKGLIPSHGFSSLIEDENLSILFDTGWNGPILLKNIEKLQKDLSKVKYIFLSHQHWDHIGGLPDVLHKIHNKVKFIIPSSFTPGFKKSLSDYGELIEVGERPYEFIPEYLSTGEMDTSLGIKEHALLINGKKRILVVGCAHPDVYNILQRSGKVDMLIGGFHDFERIELLGNMVKEKIFPCHCTKKKNEILTFYKNKSQKCGIGLEVGV